MLGDFVSEQLSTQSKNNDIALSKLFFTNRRDPNIHLAKNTKSINSQIIMCSKSIPTVSTFDAIIKNIHFSSLNIVNYINDLIAE